MSADLHLHIFDERRIDTQTLERFFVRIFGSKHFGPMRISTEQWEEAMRRVSNTPQCWIGEVSWAKAMVFEEGEELFVPSPVRVVHDLVGEELPTLDDELVNKIIAALELENKTHFRVASVPTVLPFLKAHRGERVFCVTW
jgi:hypothetical protein